MRDGWLEVTLGDVCDLSKGTSPTLKTPPGPYPLVVTGADPLSSDTFQFDGEAVCVPLVSSTGHGHASLKRVHFASGRFAVANIVAACIRKPGAPLNMRWLWLYLHHRRDELIVPRMKGTANVSLSLGALADVPINLPSLDEQKRIVDLVGALDGAITATGRSQTAALGTVTNLRRQRFNEVMEAVDSVKAGEMFAMQLGRQKSARQSIGDNVIPYLRAANLGTRGFRLEDVQVMNFSPAEQQKYCLLPGDVMLVEGGSVGLSARWDAQMPGPMGFDKHVIRIRGVAGRSTGEYALQWCRWAHETGAFDEQATGTTIRALGFGRAAAMPVPNLALEQQERLVAELAAADAVGYSYARHKDRLRDLRANVLTALLSGAHEIPDSYDELLAG